MIYIVMGVSGCGKSTVGRLLAERLAIPFYDADDFHPAANIEKMRGGRPLTDEDRQPWLEILSVAMESWNSKGDAVLACSSLKQKYRDTLCAGLSARPVFIWLDGSLELLIGRMKERTNHFMPAELLASQFQTLEQPTEALRIVLDEIGEPVSENTVAEILSRLPRKEEGAA